MKPAAPPENPSNRVAPRYTRRGAVRRVLRAGPTVAVIYVLVYWGRGLAATLLLTAAIAGFDPGLWRLRIAAATLGFGILMFRFGLVVGEAGPPPR